MANNKPESNSNGSDSAYRVAVYAFEIPDRP